MILIRGTTPIIVLKLPFAANLLAKAYITFSQCGKVVIERTLEECEIEGDTISIQLTQEETLKLSCSYPVEKQIRAIDIAGNVIASKVSKDNVEKILKEGII